MELIERQRVVSQLQIGWRRWALGLICSGGVIAWLATHLDFDQVWLSLRAANYGWVGVGLLTVLLTLWARVERWQALLDSRQVRWRGILQALVLGQLLNLIFPARLGDLGRVYLITRTGYNSQAQALGTLVLEKIWDIILLVGLVIGLSLWYPLPGWVTIPTQVTAIGGGVLLLGAVGLLLYRSKLAPQWDHAGWKKWHFLTQWPGVNRSAGRLLDGLAGLYQPQMMVAAGSWSLLAWLLGALTNLALLKAFNLPSSMGLALLLLVVLQMGVAVPSVPGRIGVFEGLCLVTLGLFGIEGNVALGYGVMLHLVVLLPPVVLGLWTLLQLDITARRALLS